VAKEVTFLVEGAPEGGYVARALGYAIFAEADSWEDLNRATRDAVQCHFDKGELPDLIRLHAVREEVLRVLTEAGLMRPQPGRGSPPPPPLSEDERQALADEVGRAPGKSLSEIVIEDRDAW
jgi:hypothetical protein